MKPTLTKKQKLLLDHIRSFSEENGYAPTFREIMEGMGYSSVATVAQHIDNLVKKGYLHKNNNEARSVQLREVNVDSEHGIELKVLGTIAAGEPITVLDDPQETLEVPPFMIRSQDSYVLQVNGQSMVEDGILDGDYIVVRENRTPREGDVVVAMINGESATLKRFYREGKRIRLQPANSTMKPIYLDSANELEIQGVVTGVLRSF